MFDSPIEACPVCGEIVVLDQTQRECSREHKCHRNTECPLRNFFTGLDFSAVLLKERLNEKGY